MLSQKLVFSKSKNFTSDCKIQMPPIIPIRHYRSSKPTIYHGDQILLFHAIVFGACACSKHFNFLKVNGLNTCVTQSVSNSIQIHAEADRCTHPGGGPIGPRQKHNYEQFNHNNFNIRYWSWNYRGCWHQTCPPIDTHQMAWF